MTSFPALLPLLLLLLADATTAAIVDLSKSWTTNALYNQNKAYCTIQAALNPSVTRGYVVIQNGEIYAESYTSGSQQNGQYDAYSATKSWSTFFIGVLVDQGKLAITDTLGTIFNQAGDWNGVGQVGEKQSVTVFELLTMTSGLVDGQCQPGFNQGQETLQAVLNHVAFDAGQRGKFNYIGQTHILARIIERRSGQSPRAFAAAAGIFSKLGMADGDFSWTTFGGVEGSAYGLLTNPRILAKLGQLYLQGGLAAAGSQLVSASWVTASKTSYVKNNLVNVDSTLDGYGYQWYPPSNGGTGANAGAAAALGANGQIILFAPASNTTIAIMGQGCMGAEGSNLLLQTIINNLGDLKVQQTSCGRRFSYWSYYTEHPTQLLLSGLREAANKLRGSNLV